jgi:hypothetical protein
MNRSERRARRLQQRKTENPKIRPMSRLEKTVMMVAVAVITSLLLFNMAAGLCPIITGKCLRCWWTKNPHCAYLARACQTITHTHHQNSLK